MAGSSLSAIFLVVCLVLGVFGKSSDPSKRDSNLSDKSNQVVKPTEFINIDDDWLKSFHRSPKQQKIQKINNVHNHDTTDDEDALSEGSGSGSESSDLQHHDQNVVTSSPKNFSIASSAPIQIENNNRDIPEINIHEGGTFLENKSATDLAGKIDHIIDDRQNVRLYKENNKQTSTYYEPEEEDDDDNDDDSFDDDKIDDMQDQNPCDDIECLFGATCVTERNDKAACVCPVGACVNHAGNPVCGSDGIIYENPCELDMVSCEKQLNITVADANRCQNRNMQMCPETLESRWSPWSLWFESGNSEFRFRICMNDGSNNYVSSGCNGETIQERMCKKQEVTSCVGPYGTKQSNYKCSGINVKDFIAAETVFAENLETEKGCLYSLYDAAEERFVHSNWTYNMILDKADKVVWCGHRGMFVPFTSPHKTCSQKLHEFCTPKKQCDPIKRKLKNKGNKKHKCWKEFVLGESLPFGMPLEDTLYICQKFAAGTDYAAVYGEKANYFTLYDRREKTPFISFGKFSQIGETTWPAVPHMVEKALVKKDQGIMKWFTTRKKMSGMAYESTMDKPFEDVCKLGAYQALLNDYIDTPYEIAPLVPPSLVGGNVGRQIAALAMTNTVPMHVSIFSSWQKLEGQVRTYAMQRCGVLPKERTEHKSPNRKPHNYPEMYIMAGRVPSKNITIGNNVNVPYLIWMTGCCVRGADASSFAAYVRNVKNGPIVTAPVEQLEVLLSDLHNTTDNVHLFPAYNKICSNIQNDASNYLKI